jgi:hypothetical protein
VILVDRPRWPAHGTRFAHLASDHSLDELHEFAGRVSPLLARPLRFHRDHYDIAEQWWQLVVDSGAHVVSTHELVRRLRAAGLRPLRR